MKTKILIVVRGGIVQHIVSNVDADIVVADFDDQSYEPLILTTTHPDQILNQGEFHTNVEDVELAAALKKINF